MPAPKGYVVQLQIDIGEGPTWANVKRIGEPAKHDTQADAQRLAGDVLKHEYNALGATDIRIKPVYQ